MNTSEFLSRAKKTTKKKSKPTERSIEDAFCKYAESRGCKALKLILLNKRGFPDRTVVCPGGRVLFIEFKKKTGKLSAPQVVMKRLLESLGFEYYVCDEVGSAESILDSFLAFDE